MKMERLEYVLDKAIRPILAAHGGTIQILGWEDGNLYVALEGRCSGCPAADFSTRQWIQEILVEQFPEIRQVVLEQTIHDDLLSQARNLLRYGHP